METSVVQQPMIIIALSPREAKAALADPEQLQSAIRREWLKTQGHTPLSLPAATESNGAKPRKPHGKMGGGERQAEEAAAQPSWQAQGWPRVHLPAVLPGVVERGASRAARAAEAPGRDRRIG